MYVSNCKFRETPIKRCSRTFIAKTSLQIGTDRFLLELCTSKVKDYRVSNKIRLTILGFTFLCFPNQLRQFTTISYGHWKKINWNHKIFAKAKMRLTNFTNLHSFDFELFVYKSFICMRPINS